MRPEVPGAVPNTLNRVEQLSHRRWSVSDAAKPFPGLLHQGRRQLAPARVHLDLVATHDHETQYLGEQVSYPLSHRPQLGTVRLEVPQTVVAWIRRLRRDELDR